MCNVMQGRIPVPTVKLVVVGCHQLLHTIYSRALSKKKDHTKNHICRVRACVCRNIAITANSHKFRWLHLMFAGKIVYVVYVYGLVSIVCEIIYSTSPDRNVQIEGGCPYLSMLLIFFESIRCKAKSHFIACAACMLISKRVEMLFWWRLCLL